MSKKQAIRVSRRTTMSASGLVHELSRAKHAGLRFSDEEIEDAHRQRMRAGEDAGARSTIGHLVGKRRDGDGLRMLQSVRRFTLQLSLKDNDAPERPPVRLAFVKIEWNQLEDELRGRGSLVSRLVQSSVRSLACAMTDKAKGARSEAIDRAARFMRGENAP